MAALGLLPSDFGDDAIEVWPDNWAAVLTFDAMSTQWRQGANGPTSLDYGVLPLVWSAVRSRLRRASFSPALVPEFPDLLEDIQVMESAALRKLHPPKPQ